MSFALDLSKRLASHESFHERYVSLQGEAAVATLSGHVESAVRPMEADDLMKLLYCANVFVQTEDESYRAMAQSIALNALLVGREDVPRDRSLRLLTDLGNFPALTYAEQRHPTKASLSDTLRKAISRELNAISVGDERIALTDFQKQTWDSLPSAQALAISAPTSAGKSFLVIEHLCRTAIKAHKFCAVYVAPTRALLSEVYATIKGRTEGVQGLRVSTVPGPDSEQSPRQIFVLTQERLQVLLAVSDLAFDMIVVDEAQNLSDGSRGMILQECLEQALDRNSQARLVMLTPGAEGFDEVEKAVGLKHLEPSVSVLPSVVQNRILVNKLPSKDALNLSLLTARGAQPIGVLASQRGFDLPATRLAAVALELGQSGGSLVYATGPSDAEKVAGQIARGSPREQDEPLEELAEFIEKHIHPRYELAALVRKGVAFHYGKMPTLLREALEAAFKSGALRYLACTTTLFQGVNLPARNVFIDTPTRGSGSKLDAAALWNFAGRAGRMKADIVGNVFLVDYDDWMEKPMDQFVGFRIEPAFGKTMAENTRAVLEALSGSMPRVLPRDETPGRVRAAAGLLISRAAKGDVRRFVDRSLTGLSGEAREELTAASESAKDAIGLPAALLATNWTVDPFGLRRLYDHMVQKIGGGEIDELIPINPHNDGKADKNYTSIFMRIQREVNGSENPFHAVVAGTAVRWMKGMPYPALLARAINGEERSIEKKKAAYEQLKAADPATRKRPPKPLDINAVIRKAFDLIEDVIRFQYVQLGKAYVEILALALRHTGHEERVKDIFDFPLALELGVATRSGWSFMELGLSRIAASALEPHFPDSNLSVQKAREWLLDVDLEPLRLSRIIVDELRRLKLVRETA